LGPCALALGSLGRRLDQSACQPSPASRRAPGRAHRASPGAVSWRDERWDYPGQREARGSDLLRRVGQLLVLRRRPRAAFRTEGTLLVARAEAVRGERQWALPHRAALQSLRRREALRSRSAPPRPVRSEGPRYGPGPAKCGGFSALHGLEQGIWVLMELSSSRAG